MAAPSSTVGAPDPSFPPSPRLGRALLGALLLFVAGRCLVPMDELDLFYNLRLGEIILHGHRIPTQNLLSFTHAAYRDVNLAWIFQILLALVHRAGGIPGTVILKTAFVLATVALLFRVAIRRGAHPMLAAGALALAAWAAEPRFVERPHLVTFLGLALLLLAVENAESAAGPDAPAVRRLRWFVPGALVWANANSCLFEAPLLLALYALGARLDGRFAAEGARPAPGVARRAALLAAAMAPFILATPSHVHALRYLANHFRMPSLRPLQEYRVAEWPTDGPFILLAAALLLSVVAAPRAARLRVLLPVVFLGLLGWRRVRFVAEFALLAGPAVAVAWTAALARLRPVKGLVRFRFETHVIVPWLAVGGLLFAALQPRVAAARAKPTPSHPAPRKWFDIGVQEGLVPTGAVAFATHYGLRDRMYNDMELGSYLSWDGWPAYKVFQDPRINGYPDDFHALMKRKDLSRTEFQALLDRYDVKAAFISYPGVNPRAALFTPETWAVVWRTDDALLFTRRIPEREAVIKENEIPVTFNYDEKEGTMVVPMLTQPAGSPIKECEWHRRLGDFFFQQTDLRRAWQYFRLAMPGGDDTCIDRSGRQAAKLAMAGLAMQLSDPAAAVRIYEGLPDPESRANRGFALLALRRPQEALAEFDAAFTLAPSMLEIRYGRGVALMDLGRPTEAIAALIDFLKGAPFDHPAVDDARKRLSALGAPLPKGPAPPPAPPSEP